jgi:fibronectin-binding autotransporter adhesin
MRQRSLSSTARIIVAATLGVAGIAHAQWAGAGAGGSATDLSDAANYTGGAASLGNLSSITSGASLDVVNTFATAAGGLNLRTGPGVAVTIGDNAGAASIQLGGNVLVNTFAAGSASSFTFGSDVTLELNGANRIIQGANAGGTAVSTLTINGGLALGANNLNVSAGDVVVNGVVTGTGSLTYGGASGVGTVTLTNAANAFTGGVNSGGWGNLVVNASTVLANAGTNSALGAGGNVGFGNATSITVQGFTSPQVTDRTFAVIGNSSFRNNGGSTVTLTGNVINNANNGQFNFGGTYTAGSNVISGLVQDGTRTLGITVNGSVWQLANDNNSYTLITSVGSNGTLEFTTIRDIGAGPSSLGNPSTGNESIRIGTGGSGTLRFVGTTAQSSNRQVVISDNGSADTYTVSANGATGASLTLTSGVVYNGTSQADKNRAFVLGGSNADANTIGNIVFNYGRASGQNGNATVTKNGTGLWVMTGTNAYNLSGAGTAGTYTTNVSAGVLRVGSSGAIPAASRLTINGGILELTAASGDFTRDTAATAADGNVQLASGGFSAIGGDRVVNFNNDSSTKTWGSNGFMTGSSTLQLATTYADSTITIQNGIDLGTSSRTVQVADGSAAVDAVLAGPISSIGSPNFTKTGSGNLTVSGSYIAAGGTIIPNGGTLLITGKVSGGVGVTSSQFGAGTATAVLTLTNDASDFTGPVGSGGQGNINFTSIADVGQPSALGSGAAPISVNNSSITFIGTTTQTSNRPWAISNTGSIVNNSTAPLKLSGDATIGTNNTLRLTAGGTSGVNEFGGAISGSGATVFKRGGGTWRLTNAGSSFTGAVSGDGGTLEATSVADSGVNSSIGAGSTIGVNNMTFSFVGVGSQSTNRLVTLDNTPALTANGPTAADTINFTGTVRNNAANARTLTLNGPNTGPNAISGLLTNGTGFGALAIVKSGAGRWNLTGTANAFTGGVTVNAGTLGAARLAGNGNVVVNGGATLQLGPGNALGVASVFGETANTLTLNGTGTLDVNRAGAVFDYDATSPEATIRARIIAGRNGGAWNGTGITSSAAAASSGYAVGYATGAEATTLGGALLGQAFDATSVLVRYTRGGDSTLDGTVNFDDLLKLAANYNVSGSGTWSNGDYNYDGNVNFDDLLILAANYNQSATGSVGGDWALAQASVPEPTTLAMIATSSVALLSRRRRTGRRR